jgi:molybdenum cofactor cytidylyltransferase
MEPPKSSARSAAKPAIAAIVLAAGRSSRMGQPKLLLPLGGRPLVSYAVEAASASSADPVIVVLGASAAEIEGVLPAGRAHVCVNPTFAAGMSSSLALGIATLSTVPPSSGRSISGTLILLADQPLISAGVVNSFLARASATPDAIIVAAYAGVRGTPVYFPSRLFDELLHITGDEGGRSVIARHPDLVSIQDIAQSERGIDVDRREELVELQSRWDHYSQYLLDIG